MNAQAQSPDRADGAPSHDHSNRDARFWDRVARKYAASKIGDPEGYERTLQRTSTLLEPTDAVLELGCGTGSTALRLAPGTGRYLATDLSPQMIAIANEKLAAAPCAGLVFSVATAEQLARDQPGERDAVLGFNVLHLVPDLGATLTAVRALVKPGGLFVSKTPCLGQMNPLIRLAIPLMRVFGKAPATVRSFTAAELKAAMVRAGFVLEATELHGSKRNDTRPFIVARRA